ncbi:hypothetical protein [Streptomyces solaniscabiei]|uniref:hypothetical protein n=1 Tax=Streptomyces solaniscabiei TaxID=2683255 RepID=UPI001CE33E3E|nr:hypothetical protein [Streptomyces solaniscabiei]
MLRSVEHWLKGLELSLDCFVCRRTRRSTSFEHGQEEGLCSADDEHPEHPSPARIAAYDVTNERERKSLRAVVDYWWAPFHDTKLPSGPGVRTFSTQTNVVQPVHDTRARCTHPLATSKNAPCIRPSPERGRARVPPRGRRQSTSPQPRQQYAP